MIHFRFNKYVRKWLNLIFMASLIANAQASVACEMMPDMSAQHTECCCGLSHRSAISGDSPDIHSSIDPTSDQLEQAQSCDNPRIGCCLLEVSVGLHDPPASDQGLSIPAKNIEHHKILKQLDNSPVFIVIYAFDIPTLNLNTEPTTVLSNPFLQLHSPPLYKTTERYRL